MAPGNQKKADDTTYVPPPGADQVQPANKGRGATNDQDLLGSMLSGALGDAPPAPPAQPARVRPPRAKELKAVASSPPARADAPAAAAAPEVARAAPPIARREIIPQVRMTGQPWWQQMVAELLGFLVVGVGAFAIDMIFTVVGVTELGMPATAPGYAIACLIHVGISIGQRHYLFQRGVARWIGALLLSVNSLSNVYGSMPVIDQLFGPQILGTVPRDPTLWPYVLIWSNLGQLWKSFWSDTLSTWTWQWPPWSASTIGVLAGCSALAWFAEYFLIYFWRRVGVIWSRQPT